MLQKFPCAGVHAYAWNGIHSPEARGPPCDVMPVLMREDGHTMLSDCWMFHILLHKLSLCVEYICLFFIYREREGEGFL
jgi:hypothetical protein